MAESCLLLAKAVTEPLDQKVSIITIKKPLPLLPLLRYLVETFTEPKPAKAPGAPKDIRKIVSPDAAVTGRSAL